MSESATRFIAYVYPGWHLDDYRPSLNEWDLVAGFQPYFPGHIAPPRPLFGAYDDSQPATARYQIGLAQATGIEAFLYFMYFGPNGSVMDKPMRIALEQSATQPGGFSVGGTLCVRLPHDRFPVSPGDELELPDTQVLLSDATLEDRPIESLTLRDLDQLLGQAAGECMSIAIGRCRRLRARPSARVGDSTGDSDD